LLVDRIGQYHGARFRRDKVAEFAGVIVCSSLRVSGGALDE